MSARRYDHFRATSVIATPNYDHLLNAIDKLVITREILLMAGIFVNGSRSKLGAVLPLLQKAGLDKCTEVFILNKSECKLIKGDTVSSAPRKTKNSTPRAGVRQPL